MNKRLPSRKQLSQIPRIGRAEAVHVRILAAQFTEQAIQTLAEIMQDKGAPPVARIVAANALLDRGWGKPAQPIEHIAEQMSDDELRQRVSAIMNNREQRPLFPEPEVIDAKLGDDTDITD